MAFINRMETLLYIANTSRVEGILDIPTQCLLQIHKLILILQYVSQKLLELKSKMLFDRILSMFGYLEMRVKLPEMEARTLRNASPIWQLRPRVRVSALTDSGKVAVKSIFPAPNFRFQQPRHRQQDRSSHNRQQIPQRTEVRSCSSAGSPPFSELSSSLLVMTAHVQSGLYELYDGLLNSGDSLRQEWSTQGPPRPV